MFGPSVTDALMALRPSSAEAAAALLSDADRARYAPAHGIFSALAEALEATLADGAARAVDLTSLDADNRTLIEEALRQGEVSIRLDGDETAIQETSLPGVWRVVGAGVDRLEIADIPSGAREAALGVPTGLDIPAAETLPEGCMNVLPVLAEIRDKQAEYEPGEENHEIVLTLLPMTPDDLEVLRTALGAGPVDILTRGYGNCRVVAGARRHVWHLTFFNSEDKMILNTVQVGDVPAAALAAPEDLQDSVKRIGEIIEAYFP